jgi:photosystem II stability/assembly factor-like uncharacterized protein
MVFAALSTVMTAGLFAGLASQTTELASATTPQWVTTASYSPLANVRAISCAPATSTCVAVGDDGGNFASIIVSNDGGTTWTGASVPTGVTSLSTVSCSSELTAVTCYAGSGSGILKSTDGGSAWVVQDASIPAVSISCLTIDQCTAVTGVQIDQTR